MAAPRHRVRHHAVDSDRGQQQGRRREDDEQQHGEAALGERSRNDLLHRSHRVDGLILGRAGYLRAHGWDQAQRLGAGAQRQRQSRHGFGHEHVRHLHEGKVNLVSYLGGIVGIQPPMLHVSHHAGDLDRAHHYQADLPADRVLAGKDALCQDVVDYHHRGRSQVIPVREKPSAPQGDLHHAGVIGSDDIEHCQRHPVLRRLRPGARPERNLAVPLAERNHRRDGSRLNSRDRRRALEQLLVCQPDARRAGQGGRPVERASAGRRGGQ